MRGRETQEKAEAKTNDPALHVTRQRPLVIDRLQVLANKLPAFQTEPDDVTPSFSGSQFNPVLPAAAPTDQQLWLF